MIKRLRISDVKSVSKNKDYQRGYKHGFNYCRRLAKKDIELIKNQLFEVIYLDYDGFTAKGSHWDIPNAMTKSREELRQNILKVIKKIEKNQ